MNLRSLWFGIFLIIPLFGHGQSLSVSVVDGTADNSISTFRMQDGNVTIQDNRIQFWNGGTEATNFSGYGVSRDQSLVALLSRMDGSGKATLLNARGDTLHSFSVTNFSADDPSTAVYPENSGHAIVRDNIANFSFYNSFGELTASISGSNQNKGAEVISELATDPAFGTIVIYTPKIKNGNSLGSQILTAGRAGERKNIYSSSGRYIKDLSMSRNGQFIVFVTSADDGDDRVAVMDKFGNSISEISTGESLAGAVLTADGLHITAFSGKRVLVYDTVSGERLGSTSFNSTVVNADYFPRDDVILVLTGDYTESSGIVNGVQFHAINIAERKVERADFSAALGFNKAMARNFIRLSANRYRFTGANKVLELSFSF